MKQPEGMSHFEAIFWFRKILGVSPGFDAAKGSQAMCLLNLQVASFLETCGWWFLTQVFLLLKSVMQIDFHLDRSITWFCAKLPDSAASRLCFCHGSSLGYLGVCRHCWEILCLCEPCRRGRSGSSRIEIPGESGTVHRGQLSWSQSIWILSGLRLPSYLNKKSYISMSLFGKCIYPCFELFSLIDHELVYINQIISNFENLLHHLNWTKWLLLGKCFFRWGASEWSLHPSRLPSSAHCATNGFSLRSHFSQEAHPGGEALGQYDWYTKNDRRV